MDRSIIIHIGSFWGRMFLGGGQTVVCVVPVVCMIICFNAAVRVVTLVFWCSFLDFAGGSRLTLTAVWAGARISVGGCFLFRV